MQPAGEYSSANLLQPAGEYSSANLLLLLTQTAAMASSHAISVSSVMARLGSTKAYSLAMGRLQKLLRLGQPALLQVDLTAYITATVIAIVTAPCTSARRNDHDCAEAVSHQSSPLRCQNY